MIKQVILDMENQLLQVKTQVAIAMADQHLLEKKAERERRKDFRMGPQGGDGRWIKNRTIWRAPPLNARFHYKQMSESFAPAGGRPDAASGDAKELLSTS